MLMKIPDPGMKLAILTVHCDKVTKELNAKQPSILLFIKFVYPC